MSTRADRFNTLRRVSPQNPVQTPPVKTATASAQAAPKPAAAPTPAFRAITASPAGNFAERRLSTSFFRAKPALRAAAPVATPERQTPDWVTEVFQSLATPPQPSTQVVDPEPDFDPAKRAAYSLNNRARMPVATERPKVNYTDEQQTIIEDRSAVIVVRAFAGGGKTTLAVGYTDARPKAKHLYMAFNKGIQTEAQGRFGPNTKCQTTHSLAYQAIGKNFKERVVHSWRPLTLRNEAGLSNTRAAAITQSVLSKFFQSADLEVKMDHTKDAELAFRAQDRELHEAVASAKIMWRRMQDTSDRVSIPHDAYLKMWSLTNPKLPYDHIIFDEAQDSNPVTAHVVRQQTHAKLLYIGDPHQSIYGFRGAINAMDDLGAAASIRHLSQTWRFGPEIAKVANLLLGELKGETVPIVGRGQDRAYRTGAAVTKLARTNAQLFKDATLVHGRGVHWVGGVESYQLNKILDAYNLYAGRRDQIYDPFLRNFSSWAELTAYAEEAKDPEARIMAEVIEEYRHETPGLIDEIKHNEVKDAANASLVLTTAHKAKGLEWDYVQIADDFEILNDTEASLAADPYATIEEQEINLLYVACTRAKCALQLNSETKSWLADLPKHHAARLLATQRMQARLAGLARHPAAR